MKQNISRTRHSIINIFFGVLNQILIIVLGFVSRTIFLKFLNDSYLGINGLFTEVISMLSLADLGLATVMTYSFFEPLSKKDYQKISRLTNFYEKLYTGIAVIVASVGVLLIPFLKYIVNLEQGVDNLYLYYLLFLAKTVVSYLFVYKTSILNADQNNYIVSRISIYIRILTVVGQVVILAITRSYFLYLGLDLFTTWLNNYLCAKKADQLYPFLDKKLKLEKEEKKEIINNIKSGFLYKLSGVLLNSTDNTLISIIIGTITVGYYSNYSMIFTRIQSLVNTFYASLNGSLGNLIATEEKEKRYEIFSILQMIGFISSTLIIVCCYTLIDDFVSLWIGAKYVLSKDVIIACVINLYLSIVLQPLWAYRDATGLFRKTKYVMLLTAVVNLVLSIILGNIYGLSGIIIASAISRLVTYVWYEPVVLYKEYFGVGVHKFFLKQGYNILVVIIICFVVNVLFGSIECVNWGTLFLKGIAVFLTTALLSVMLFCWSKDLKKTIVFIKERIMRK